MWLALERCMPWWWTAKWLETAGKELPAADTWVATLRVLEAVWVTVLVKRCALASAGTLQGRLWVATVWTSFTQSCCLKPNCLCYPAPSAPCRPTPNSWVDTGGSLMREHATNVGRSAISVEWKMTHMSFNVIFLFCTASAYVEFAFCVNTIIQKKLFTCHNIFIWIELGTNLYNSVHTGCINFILNIK